MLPALTEEWREEFTLLNKRLSDAHRSACRKASDLQIAERRIRDMQVRCERLERENEAMAAVIRSAGLSGAPR